MSHSIVRESDLDLQVQWHIISKPTGMKLLRIPVWMGFSGMRHHIQIRATKSRYLRGTFLLPRKELITI